MSAPKYPELFPPALGNEEESMLMMGQESYHLGDPYDFVAEFERYIPSAIKTTKHENKFMQNGGLMYDGGAFLDADQEKSVIRNINLERVTPECATPAEVATYIQANEQIYVEMLKNYVRSGADFGYHGVARAQRRVVDGQGNSRGCHDSIEARRPDWLADFDHNEAAKSVLLRFLQTRSFVTGAGYVDEKGAHFAQKVETLTSLTTYGYISSAYRNASESETGPRLEIRCNDINISPWAIQARIGGAALLFTVLQTPLIDRLAAHAPSGLSERAHLNNFRRFNTVSFDEEDQVVFTRDIAEALEFQERVFEVIDDELGKFVDIDDDYQRLIWEMRYYLQDFRDVLHGKSAIATLANRSDNAAKFNRIFDMQRKAKAIGVQRKLGDIESEATDFKYDHITVDVSESGQVRTNYGSAYKLRDKGHFRLAIRPSDVEHAMYYPPAATRASTRGRLILRDEIEDCDWTMVKYKGEDAPRLGLGPVMLKDAATVDSTLKKSSPNS